MGIIFRKMGGRIVPILQRAGKADLHMDKWPHRQVKPLMDQVSLVKRVRQLAKADPSMKRHKAAAKVYGQNINDGVKSYLKSFGKKK